MRHKHHDYVSDPVLTDLREPLPQHLVNRIDKLLAEWAVGIQKDQPLNESDLDLLVKKFEARLKSQYKFPVKSNLLLNILSGVEEVLDRSLSLEEEKLVERKLSEIF